MPARMMCRDRKAASLGGTSAILCPTPGQFSRSRKPKLVSWQLSVAMQLMRSRMSDRILISEVAAACRLSTSYFVRAFTNTMGIAPHGWLIEQRIAMARRLLQQTSIPLAQIALECGFSDQSHLTNVFRQRLGVTPSKWRNAARGGGGYPVYQPYLVAC